MRGLFVDIFIICAIITDMITEKIAFVFPGQGSQYIGMARDLYDNFDVVRHTFEQVSDISHKNIADACFNGPADVLNKPELTSLGTFAHSVSVARIVESAFNMPLYEIGYAIVGHSMGQYSALQCAGSLSMKDAVHLLSARSNYMSMAGKGGGGMACIVGLDKETVEKCLLAATNKGYAAISNLNSRTQFTISGQNEALDAVVARAKTMGAKLAKRLNVAVPAHCALMENAEKSLRNFLNTIDVQAPKTNWFSNQTAMVMSNPQDVKDALANQMSHGVNWVQIMENFPEYNITRAYEFGPGRTLTGLINRANVGCQAKNTDNLGNVRAMLGELERCIVR